MKHDNARVGSRSGRESAEEIAGEALLFLACDNDRLDRFLTLSGIDPATIRGAASMPGFLVGVLDHILGDESLLLALAANSGRSPESIVHARQRLDGGDD